MNLLASDTPPAAGACYRFVVDSADQAAALIRDRLGEHARVLSVRSVAGSGWKRLLSAPKLEVIAQIDAPIETGASVQCELTQPAMLLPAAAPEHRRPSASARSLPELLRGSGFSPAVLSRLQTDRTWAEQSAAPLHQAVVAVGRQLCAEIGSRPARPPLSRAAFLGASGVGRSTALCKWLAHEVYRRARLGHVVLAEFDRPNMPGPLPVFCEALGVALAHFPAQTQPVIPGGFVYFDLPGLSLRAPEDNASIEAFLDEEQITERVLVVNAAYDNMALRRTFAVGRGLSATHVIFTHLDEAPQWGRLWEYLLEADLEPLFLSTGPSLTGDCELEPVQALARRTLPLSD
ncbi:MAG: flagellar GTP-binding protein [Opitutae bacterium]